MLNAEKYKYEIAKAGYDFGLYDDQCIDVCDYTKCPDCKFYNEFTGCRAERIRWLLEECKEILLTEEEKKFLLPVINAIKPFINIKPYIVKYRASYPRGYIEINYGETTRLPLVNADKCFIKLKYGKVYTLEELGLC